MVVSILALAFTILSFWYMNWRRGVLRVGSIKHFGAGKAREGNEDNKNIVVITLPLILFNTGARPIVLESLRLVPKSIDKLSTLLFERVDDQITIMPQGQHKITSDHFFIPLLLKPNEVVKGNFVFEARKSEFEFSKTKYSFKLEAQVSGRNGWRKIKHIEIDFTGLNDIELYNLNEFFSVFSYRVDEND